MQVLLDRTLNAGANHLEENCWADGSGLIKSLTGHIHCGSQGIVYALLPARTLCLKMREDIAVDLQ
ncbi:uncharacterized Zn finger protein (UPF0148 family) [Agrobacterium fabrum]|nr:uncharacterized Zn finger protein (UPF0148 family) [Agrobacterium fabrum]